MKVSRLNKNRKTDFRTFLPVFSAKSCVENSGLFKASSFPRKINLYVSYAFFRKKSMNRANHTKTVSNLEKRRNCNITVNILQKNCSVKVNRWAHSGRKKENSRIIYLKSSTKQKCRKLFNLDFWNINTCKRGIKREMLLFFTLNKEGIHKNKKVGNAKNRNLEKNYEFCNFCVFKLPFLWYDDNRRCD